MSAQDKNTTPGASSMTPPIRMVSVPSFGAIVENGWASEDNPTRLGFFVREFKRTGRLNPGRTWEITDGKGKFWELKPSDIGERLKVTDAAPVREEGGAVRLGESDLFGIADIIRLARGVKHVGFKDYAVADEIVCFVNNHLRTHSSALATREEAPAEAGERSVMVCPRCEGEGEYADGVDEAACSTPCTRCNGNGWLVDLEALRAQPPAREDAQPVGWQRRIRNTTVSSSDPKSQWSKWTDCDDRQRRDVQETGGVPGFPELVAEVRPIYTRPAPDALRVAVAKLEKAKITDDPAEVFMLAMEALAALQAEQKGGA